MTAVDIEPLGLFPEPEHAGPMPLPEDATAGERRRARQAAAIARGHHPLSVALRAPLPLHPLASRDVGDPRDGTPRCGTCDHRERMATGASVHAKCTAGAFESSRPVYRGETGAHVRPDGRVAVTVYPRRTHGPGTDVQRGFPACVDYYRAGDTELSGPASSV